MIEKMKLMPDDISPDIKKALEELSHDAKSGDLIGLAFIGVYKRREFVVNVAG